MSAKPPVPVVPSPQILSKYQCPRKAGPCPAFRRAHGTSRPVHKGLEARSWRETFREAAKPNPFHRLGHSFLPSITHELTRCLGRCWMKRQRQEQMHGAQWVRIPCRRHLLKVHHVPGDGAAERRPGSQHRLADTEHPLHNAWGQVQSANTGALVQTRRISRR